MAISAAAVIVPLGILFFVSGLIINLIQAICFVLIRPLSKSTYRRINRLVAELLWLELVWLIDWWAGVKVIGWSMWFSEYLFLERNWAKDESTIKSGLQRLEDYPQPFWLALFVEGTRFTPCICFLYFFILINIILITNQKKELTQEIHNLKKGFSPTD